MWRVLCAVHHNLTPTDICFLSFKHIIQLNKSCNFQKCATVQQAVFRCRCLVPGLTLLLVTQAADYTFLHVFMCEEGSRTHVAFWSEKQMRQHEPMPRRTLHTFPQRRQTETHNMQKSLHQLAAPSKHCHTRGNCTHWSRLGCETPPHNTYFLQGFTTRIFNQYKSVHSK